MKWLALGGGLLVSFGVIWWLARRKEPEGTYRQQLDRFAESCADLPKPKPFQEQVRREISDRVTRFKHRMEA